MTAIGVIVVGLIVMVMVGMRRRARRGRLVRGGWDHERSQRLRMLALFVSVRLARSRGGGGGGAGRDHGPLLAVVVLDNAGWVRLFNHGRRGLRDLHIGVVHPNGRLNVHGAHWLH